MIQLLKDYYDIKGNRYKTISFIGGKYLCQSYSTGKTVYMSVNELHENNPKQQAKKEDVIAIPVYEFDEPEPVKVETKEVVEDKKPKASKSKKTSSVSRPKEEEKIQDNKEAAVDDFYADL